MRAAKKTPKPADSVARTSLRAATGSVWMRKLVGSHATVVSSDDSGVTVRHHWSGQVRKMMWKTFDLFWIPDDPPNTELRHGAKTPDV